VLSFCLHKEDVSDPFSPSMLSLTLPPLFPLYSSPDQSPSCSEAVLGSSVTFSSLESGVVERVVEESGKNQLRGSRLTANSVKTIEAGRRLYKDDLTPFILEARMEEERKDGGGESSES